MQEGAASESSPRDAYVVQGLGPGPLLESLLANLEEDSTTALTLLGAAHDMHAPLVLDAVITGARLAHNVTLGEGQGKLALRHPGGAQRRAGARLVVGAPTL
jgi:hypothetical protein